MTSTVLRCYELSKLHLPRGNHTYLNVTKNSTQNRKQHLTVGYCDELSGSTSGFPTQGQPRDKPLQNQASLLTWGSPGSLGC